LEKVFECRNLQIRYGLKQAVKDLSFSLERGQSLALVGQNGAGKTSTIKALIGYLPTKKDQVQVLGKRPPHWKIFEGLGFAPETGSPPDYLNAKEYLELMDNLKRGVGKGLSSTPSDLLSLFDLDPRKKIREYSKGMKRKLILAQAFVGNPSLVILDEPLNGLDPLMIIRLREWINQYRNQGCSVVYSSHILSEVEKSCDRMLLIHEGKALLEDSIENIRKEFGGVEEAYYQKVGKA